MNKSKFKKGSKVKYNKKPGRIIEIINNKIYILLDEPRGKSLYPEKHWIINEEYLDTLVSVHSLEVIKIKEKNNEEIS